MRLQECKNNKKPSAAKEPTKGRYNDICHHGACFSRRGDKNGNRIML